ncbi:YDG domain-containing protein [Pseudoduganella aquatica]|uniref:YDG domain-containing protein n=1 Tax=Pseudoduganella aquatica TaxID=2660641 RepID=UPI001E559CD1|nr:YDG domain-containing protein [Pseudoduganella aquatica]
MMTGPVPQGMRRKLLAVLVAACYGSAYGNPSTPQVVAGQATFLQQGNLYSITNTPNTIINWQNFSINPNEITRFIQQSGDSKVLNRIVGQDPSKILGSLQSNGKVYLINPNGILFGKDARVDVNGLVASSLAISNSDFLAGKNHFGGAGAGKVINQGSITTPSGGQVYLIGSGVENSGVITSPQGEVVLAAGNSVQLVDSANPDVHVVVSAPADQALNLGQVLAAGGKVGIYGALVNQRGRINADSATVGENGKIVLKAGGANSTTMLEAGSQTSATNSAGKGGEIQLLGERVGLSGNAAVDASGAAGGGSVLIGGDYQGQNAAVPHARQTYIGADASVRADATVRGDGGKIIAWSDGATRVFGQLSARGGAQGGDGGLVETSGHYLDMQGKVDTRAQAPGGKSGTLLLDPTDIYIADNALAAFYGGGMPLTAPPLLQDLTGKIFEIASVAHESLLTTSALQALLDTTDVTVRTTNSSGTGDGSIHVINAVGWTSASSLTLQADKDIFLKAGISAPNAALNLNAGAGRIVQTTSPVDGLTAKSLSALAAGDITLDNTGNGVSGATTLNSTSSTGNITLSGQSFKLGNSSAGGNLTVSAANGDLAVTGTVTAGGAVALSTLAGAGHRITNSGGVTSGASIELNSDKMTLAGGTLTAPSVLLKSGNAINLGATTSTAGTLELSTADLASVTANELQVTVTGGEKDILVSASLAFGKQLALTATHDITLGAAVATGGLTLSASRDIAATGSVAVDGTFNLVQGSWSQNANTLPAFSAKDFRLSGGTFLRGYGTGDSGYMLSDVYGLQGVATLGSSLAFTLGGNIDATGTSLWNGGAGFKPIGNSDYAYSGIFDGYGKTITGLVINRPEINNVGLFSHLGSGSTVRDLVLQGASVTGAANVGALAGNSGGTVRNVVLQGGSVTGTENVGALAGYNSGIAIEKVASSASVSGIRNAGGLVGNTTGNITESSATGAVTGRHAAMDANSIGGLVGLNSGAITKSFATGAVDTIGQGYAGGLVGTNSGTVTSSYASGAVATIGEIVGGLVGDNYGTIARSYATGNVAAGRNVGGLVGRNGYDGQSAASLSNVYASGNVSHRGSSTDFVHNNAGGLLGEFAAGAITNAYATGQVDGSGFGTGVNGLVGFTNGSQVVHGYYDTTKAGRSTDAAGGIGLTTAQTKLQSSFEDFFTGDVWRIYDGYTTPLLKDFLTPVTVTVTGSNASAVYGNVLPTYTGTPTYDGLLNGDSLSGTLGWGAAKNVGTYSTGGLYSTAYDITYAAGAPTLAITRRELTATIGGSKVYDGTTTFSNASATLSGVAYDDVVSASVSASYADKNAGTGKALSGVELHLNESAASNNYTLKTTYNSDAEITRAALSVGGISGVNRVYNGTTAATVNAAGDWSVHGLSGDTVTAALAGGYTFSDKNVGVEKSIRVPLTLSGTDAGNYLPYTTTYANISAAPLSISGLTGVNRVYDGTNNATVGNATFSGVFGSDVVTLGTVHAYFTGGKNVGSNKAIAFEGLASLGGADGANYQVTGAMPGNVSASITPATLTVNGITAQNRAYNGGTGVTLNVGEGGNLSGVILGDNVLLNSSSMSGSFADRNVGNGKTVTVSGLSLDPSADSGNYVLAAPTLTANITQLGKAIWTGSAGNNLWSDASNWAGGAVPTASNVIAAELSAYGGAVIYDGGATTLNSLTSVHGQGLTMRDGALTLGVTSGDTSSLSGGALSLTSGSLNLVGSLTSGSYAQTGGTLNGGSSGRLTTNTFNQSGGTISGLTGLTVNSQYAQSGGSIAIPGTVTIHHYTGNLVVGSISALESIALYTGEGGGGISQNGALNTGTLTVSSQGGVTLNNSGNHVLHFSGSNSGGSGISLYNTLSGEEQLAVGPLSTTAGSLLIDNVGGIYTAGTLSAGGGAIFLTAHSPITISDTLVADSISLSASTGISLTQDANLQANHNISMVAGTGIALAGMLNSSHGSINLQAQTGSITADPDMHITGAGAVRLTAPHGSISAPSGIFQGGSQPVLTDSAAAAAAAAKAAAEAAAQAAAEAAAKAAAEAAAKAAAEKAAAEAAAKAAAEKAAAEAAAKAAAEEAAAKAAAEAAAKAAAEEAAAKAAAEKAAAEAAAKAAAEKAAAEAAAKAAAEKAAAEAAAKAAAEKAAAEAAAKAAAEKAAAEAAAKAAAEKAAAEAAAKAAAEAAAKAAAEAAAKAAAEEAAAKAAAEEAAAKAAAEAAAKAAADAAAKAAADAAAKAAADAAAKAAADAAAKAAADAAAKAAADAAAKAAADAAAKAAAEAAAKAAADAAAAKQAADAAAAAAQNDSTAPVGQALNSTVNIINTAAGTPGKQAGSTPDGAGAGSAGSSSAASSQPADTKKDDGKKEDSKDSGATGLSAVKTEPTKKMYCN